MTRSELHIAYAKVILLLSGTGLKPEVHGVLFDGDKCVNPTFRGEPDLYEFAIGIVAGKPVFPNDTLYYGNTKFKAIQGHNGTQYLRDTNQRLFLSEKCTWVEYSVPETEDVDISIEHVICRSDAPIFNGLTIKLTKSANDGMIRAQVMSGWGETKC
jgi:hypothetical protein